MGNSKPVTPIAVPALPETMFHERFMNDCGSCTVEVKGRGSSPELLIVHSQEPGRGRSEGGAELAPTRPSSSEPIAMELPLPLGTDFGHTNKSEVNYANDYGFIQVPEGNLYTIPCTAGQWGELMNYISYRSMVEGAARAV